MLIEGLYTLQQFDYTDNQVKASILLHKESDVFKGHFPGNPVMPGVCMIQIIKELTEKALKKDVFLAKSSNIKFMSIINPEEHPLLDIVIDITATEDEVKIKSTSAFEETMALKLNAFFKILD